MLNLKKGKHSLQEKEQNDKLKEKVLVIDDEKTNLYQMDLMLRKKYQVLTATSGAAGLEILKDPDIVTIISDQQMPGMNGVEFFIEVEKLHYPAMPCLYDQPANGFFPG